MRTRKRKQKAVPSESDSESESEQPINESESDSDIPEGINDLMNLPIELLRKELINRKFQPTVINNLPKWQLSAMLRESTANSYDSFFYKIMGYSSYWTWQNKPAFNKKSFDEFQQQKDDDATEDDIEEEEESSETEVDVKEFKKTRRKISVKKQNDTENILNPDNYQHRYINGQYKYYPKTLITNLIYKRQVPPEYQPPQVIDTVQTTEKIEPEQNVSINDQIIDDPNTIPEAINTQLLNYGVLQSSIDDLNAEQIKKIRDDSKSKDFNVFDLIEMYNLETAQKMVLVDSQFSDTQTQKSEENSDSDDDSSSDSSSDSDSSKNSSDKEDDEDEDDHMNERY